jgi:hypothetical protein
MNPATIIGGIVILGLLVVLIIAIRERRSSVMRPQGALASPIVFCVFCHRAIGDNDQVAGLNERSVRQLLGRMPTDHSAARDRQGVQRWLSHVACASKAGGDVKNAPRVGGDSRKGKAGGMTCPMCGHKFTPPHVTIVTTDLVKKYGNDPVQCPQCRHTWNGGRDIHTVRG